MKYTKPHNLGALHNIAIFTLALFVILISVTFTNADTNKKTITITKQWSDNLTGNDATNRTPPQVVINATMTQQEMFDMLYPVGSVYETANASFNPNTSWYGEWVEDDAGRVLVSAGTNDSATYTTGTTGGERTHVLTPSETATKAHSHTYSKSNTATNNTTLTINQIPSHEGHLPVNSGSHTGYGNAGGKYLPQAAFPYTYGSTGRGWDVQGGEMTPTGINTGGGQGHNHGISLSNATTAGDPSNANGSAHNNMQPYKVVKRWRRTA